MSSRDELLYNGAQNSRNLKVQRLSWSLSLSLTTNLVDPFVHRIIQTLLNSLHLIQPPSYDLPIHCQYLCFYGLTSYSLFANFICADPSFLCFSVAYSLPLLYRLVEVQDQLLLIMSSSTHTRTRTISEATHQYTQEERQAAPR